MAKGTNIPADFGALVGWDHQDLGDRVMVLKRGENVGDRYVKHSTEQEILGLIVQGTPETALTADQAVAKAA